MAGSSQEIYVDMIKYVPYLPGNKTSVQQLYYSPMYKVGDVNNVSRLYAALKDIDWILKDNRILLVEIDGNIENETVVQASGSKYSKVQHCVLLETYKIRSPNKV